MFCHSSIWTLSHITTACPSPSFPVDNGTSERSSMTDVIVAILDANDNSPVITSVTPRSVTVPEDASVNYVLPVEIVVTDPDSGENSEVSLLADQISLGRSCGGKGATVEMVQQGRKTRIWHIFVAIAVIVVGFVDQWSIHLYLVPCPLHYPYISL